MTTFLTVLLPLLDPVPDPDDVKPGLLGFVVFLLLAAAVVFLAFSLRKHLGKVHFDNDQAPDDRADGPDGNHPDR